VWTTATTTAPKPDDDLRATAAVAGGPSAAAAVEDAGQKRSRVDEAAATEGGASALVGAAAAAGSRDERAQRSRKRNKATQTRVDVQRRPCFLPLPGADPLAAREIAAFFGLGGSSPEIAAVADAADLSPAAVPVQPPCGNLVASLAVGAYHKDRSMVYRCSVGALRLQAHASLSVASFGEPFAKRMDSDAKHW
jgi:hypothetical protein